MKTSAVTLSGKYQVVIPKAARKKLGLTRAAGQRFVVAKVTDTEIVFRKDKTLDDFLGAYSTAFPENSSKKLRQLREQEWD